MLNNYDVLIKLSLKKNITAIVNQGRLMLKPRKQISVSAWADANRVLPETSAESGIWRTSRVPWTREIMDAASDGDVRQITIMGSSQIAKTETLNNIVGYLIEEDPCHIMFMQPTDKDARDYSQQKLEPMINDVRSLKERVFRNKKDKDNSILRKKFPGGFLTIISGTTSRSTRQRSARVTIADDIDGIELTVKEGDPVSRLMKRSTTYYDSLNINVSTPTLEDSSRIALLFNQSNMKKWYCPCLHCGKEQVLRYENLTWEKDYDLMGRILKHHVETVRYACQGCGVLMDESERLMMISRGRWIAEKPYIKRHEGFWINELSSSLSSMEKVARAIVDAGEDESKLEALYNTVLGLPYKRVRGKEVDPLQLMDMVEEFSTEPAGLPNEVLFLTAAVDVQAGGGDKLSRLEVEVWGWGFGKERWLVYKDKILGNIKTREIWDKLDELWDVKWFRADGVQLRIARKFIDSGFETQTVYEYVRKREHDGIYAIKGSNRLSAELMPKAYTFVDKGKVRMVVVGVQRAKHELFSCLDKVRIQGPKYTHFPKRFCNSEYFKQLTAEHAVTKGTGMFEVSVYMKKRKDLANEALDLFVYNYAAMEHLNPNWEMLKANMAKKAGLVIKEVSASATLSERNDEAKVIEKVKPSRRTIGRAYANSGGWSI